MLLTLGVRVVLEEALLPSLTLDISTTMEISLLQAGMVVVMAVVRLRVAREEMVVSRYCKCYLKKQRSPCKIRSITAFNQTVSTIIRINHCS